jgi:hypothetical protein
MREVDARKLYMSLCTPEIIIERLRYFYKTMPDAGILYTQAYAIDGGLARVNARERATPA